MDAIPIADLRRFAVRRSLLTPTTLQHAIERLGFVQADPIRAPARAQDLILRHRANAYRAGDLERQYAALGVEEDVFVNYGFVTRSLQAVMHPRTSSPRGVSATKRERLLLDFVRRHGEVHPRDVDAHFSHGTVTNYWGGSSNATTHLLDAMHYRGLLRVVRREAGIRIYGPKHHAPQPLDAAGRRARVDALVDTVVRKYAPLPSSSLSFVIRRLRYAAPQWQSELTGAIQRSRQRLTRVRVEGEDWYWTPDESPGREPAADEVRLLAPFDPIVWDRRRFELLWGWAYRFEAYTPVPKRKLGYYALPLLWRDRVIGWGNVSIANGVLDARIGYVNGTPKERTFRRELDAEIDRMRMFLGRESPARDRRDH